MTADGNSQSTAIIDELTALYEETNPTMSFKYESLGGADLSRKIQLLAASNDLPAVFSYPSGKPLLDLIDSHAVLDMEETFRQLGIYDSLLPTAVELLKSHVDGKGLYALPLELNIEGFWYNKAIFARFGLDVPRTWDEMLDAAAALQREGVQPFALAGKEKWPITRMINAYIIRAYGADAMLQVDRGERRLTDPGFIEAAKVVQDMALQGYYGVNVSKVDFRGSMQAFMQGRAAMFYSGSWSLRQFNNPRDGELPSDQIGFFSVPLVEGGAGTLEEYPVNAGLTASFAKESYNADVGEWMKFVFARYGDHAMASRGMITGFKVEHMPDHVPALTQLVQQQIATLQKGALWFEARFSTEEQLAAWDNALLLVTNKQYKPEEYMRELQALIDANHIAVP